MSKHGLVIASIAAFAVARVLAFAYGAQMFDKAEPMMTTPASIAWCRNDR